MPPAIITVEVTFDATPGRTLIQPAPAGGGNQATLAVPLERFDEASIPWEISPDASDPEDQPTGTVTVVYVTGRIVPADGQRGETGDMVDSIRGDTGQRHYVSPRKPPSLPDGYGEFINMDASVQLMFEGMTREEFNQHLEWELLDGMLIPMGDVPLLLVPRSNPKHFPVRVLLKETGTPVALLNTWIVWVEVAALGVGDELHVFGNPFTVVESFPEVTFAGMIRPAAILDLESDIPNLRGSPQTDVPEKGVVHPTDGREFENPLHKWHFSRRLRLRMSAENLDPDDLGMHKDSPLRDQFPVNQLTVMQTTGLSGADGYPKNPLKGNDTSLPGSHPDPYVGDPDTLSPKGTIIDRDTPKTPINNQAGAVGAKYLRYLEFQQFARLEIGNNWYLVSSYVPWRFGHTFQKKDEAIEEEDYNKDGDMEDILWVPTGSNFDLSNDDWPQP